MYESNCLSITYQYLDVVVATAICQLQQLWCNWHFRQCQAVNDQFVSCTRNRFNIRHQNRTTLWLIMFRKWYYGMLSSWFPNRYSVHFEHTLLYLHLIFYYLRYINLFDAVKLFFAVYVSFSYIDQFSYINRILCSYNDQSHVYPKEGQLAEFWIFVG